MGDGGVSIPPCSVIIADLPDRGMGGVILTGGGDVVLKRGGAPGFSQTTPPTPPYRDGLDYWAPLVRDYWG